VYINNHQGQNHFLGIDLIDGAQPFDEMSRRIDVRPPLPNMREQLGEKTGTQCVRAFVIPVNRFPRFVRKAWPAGIPGANSCVRSTYFFEAWPFWIFQSGAAAFSLFATEYGDTKVSDIPAATMSFQICISALLNHDAARSQQVRITPNKFSSFHGSEVLLVRIVVVINSS